VAAPHWSTEPFKRYLAYLEESDRILRLSMTGIGLLRTMPRAMEALAMAEPPAESERENHIKGLEKVKEAAEFATTEVERGFPLLHAHTLVGIWGAMEATVEDVQVAFLLNDAETLRNEAFSKIKVPLAHFESLEREERMRLLAHEFERNLGMTRREGVERFEGLLEPLGLSGKVEPAQKKAIYEMHHVRNVLVHRAAIADRRIVEGCPWLNLKVGDRVVVTPGSLLGYGNALTQYVTELICRVGTNFGMDMRGVKKPSKATEE
jgi:hypothetical protein